MKRKLTAMERCEQLTKTLSTDQFSYGDIMRAIRAAIREAVKDATTCEGCEYIDTPGRHCGHTCSRHTT